MKRKSMKRSLLILTLAVTALLFSGIASASDSSHSGHSHSGHDMNHDDHGSGKKIHHAMVDGLMFEYRLIDMKEKMKGMKNMPEMKETHHLMLHVKDSHGKMIEKAKVGYLIQGPGNSVEKKMAMAMNKGFGADVTFEHGKTYTVKAKVVAGDKKLMDSFEFTPGH